MARYRVLARSYIGRLLEPGDIVEWDGVAGGNLQKLGAPRRPRRRPDLPSAAGETHPTEAALSGDQGKS